MGDPQTLGLAIILLIAFLAWRLRHRSPLFTFGVAWTAIGLLPVSNVLVPTGIMLAERTLITPSVGAMLAVVALGSMAVRAVGVQRRTVARRAGYAVLAIVLVMGITRSFSRHQIWRNQLILWRQTVIDAPDGYRGRVALGALMLGMGWTDRGRPNCLKGSHCGTDRRVRSSPSPIGTDTAIAAPRRCRFMKRRWRSRSSRRVAPGW